MLFHLLRSLFLLAAAIVRAPKNLVRVHVLRHLAGRPLVVVDGARFVSVESPAPAREELSVHEWIDVAEGFGVAVERHEASARLDVGDAVPYTLGRRGPARRGRGVDARGSQHAVERRRLEALLELESDLGPLARGNG